MKMLCSSGGPRLELAAPQLVLDRGLQTVHHRRLAARTSPQLRTICLRCLSRRCRLLRSPYMRLGSKRRMTQNTQILRQSMMSQYSRLPLTPQFGRGSSTNSASHQLIKMSSIGTISSKVIDNLQTLTQMHRQSTSSRSERRMVRCLHSASRLIHIVLRDRGFLRARQ